MVNLDLKYDKKDLYGVLGVARDASKSEIKVAYRKLAKKFHPDNNDHLNAEEVFRDINFAYETLSDDTKRANYDKYGFNGINGPSLENFMQEIDDIFETTKFTDADLEDLMPKRKKRKMRKSEREIVEDMGLKFDDEKSSAKPNKFWWKVFHRSTKNSNENVGKTHADQPKSEPSTSQVFSDTSTSTQDYASSFGYTEAVQQPTDNQSFEDIPTPTQDYTHSSEDTEVAQQPTDSQSSEDIPTPTQDYASSFGYTEAVQQPTDNQSSEDIPTPTQDYASSFGYTEAVQQPTDSQSFEDIPTPTQDYPASSEDTEVVQQSNESVQECSCEATKNQEVNHNDNKPVDQGTGHQHPSESEASDESSSSNAPADSVNETTNDEDNKNSSIRLDVDNFSGVGYHKISDSDSASHENNETNDGYAKENITVSEENNQNNNSIGTSGDEQNEPFKKQSDETEQTEQTNLKVDESEQIDLKTNESTASSSTDKTESTPQQNESKESSDKVDNDEASETDTNEPTVTAPPETDKNRVSSTPNTTQESDNQPDTNVKANEVETTESTPDNLSKVAFENISEVNPPVEVPLTQIEKDSISENSNLETPPIANVEDHQNQTTEQSEKINEKRVFTNPPQPSILGEVTKPDDVITSINSVFNDLPVELFQEKNEVIKRHLNLDEPLDLRKFKQLVVERDWMYKKEPLFENNKEHNSASSSKNLATDSGPSHKDHIEQRTRSPKAELKPDISNAPDLETANVVVNIHVPQLVMFAGDTKTLTYSRIVRCHACQKLTNEDKLSCAICGGSGLTSEKVKLSIQLPVNSENFISRHFFGFGNANVKNDFVGDLIVNFHVKNQSEFFTADEFGNLYITIHVDGLKVNLERYVKIPTLSGRIKIPIKEISTDEEISIEGYGLQEHYSETLKRNLPVGKLIVDLVFEFCNYNVNKSTRVQELVKFSNPRVEKFEKEIEQELKIMLAFKNQSHSWNDFVDKTSQD